MEKPEASGGGPGNQRLFRILRYFSLASLASILVAAALLTTLYRVVAIRDLIQLGERGNQQLAQGFLDVVRAPLLGYLGDEEHHRDLPVPPEVVRALADLMHNTGVTRVMIYDDEGIVLFSNRRNLIGTSHATHPDFLTGMAGRVFSQLMYRHRLVPLGEEVDPDQERENVIQTNIPIRPVGGGPVLGVFEIHSDVDTLVARIEQAEFMILGGSVTILALLYLALLAIVHRAERIIVAQERTIRDHNHALELLSGQLITAQEDERKRLAYDLHEGIAQNLSSIKYQMETACRPDGQPCQKNFRPNEAIVPTLQKTIQEVRTLAIDLRPSSLDDLGLLPTLEWYCREFRAIYPEIDLRFASQAEESDIPGMLRVVLFRLIQQMLQYIARQGSSSLVQLQLRKAEGQIRLVLSDSKSISDLDDERATQRELHLVTLRERITLAGGEMEVITADETTGSTIRASWWTWRE